MKRLILALTLTMLSATYGKAEQWKSSDGVIVCEIPDSERFVEIQPDPPAKVFWLSPDETLKLGIIESPAPIERKIIQSALEQGLAEDLDGEILDSTVVEKNGHQVFLISAAGGALGDDAILSQAIVKVGGKFYKLMVFGIGKDPRQNSDAQAFLNSLEIIPPYVEPTGSTETVTPSLNDLSGKIGAYSLIALVVGIIILYSRKKSKPNTEEQNPVE
ncbi:hypothetical protein [Bremerella cremea]|uniref:hypothetical protein n=1 Tax=Bremerella cremea TaxID=1031537 RepID=UPI0031EB4270